MTPTDYQKYIDRIDELSKKESITFNEETELNVLKNLCKRYETNNSYKN